MFNKIKTAFIDLSIRYKLIIGMSAILIIAFPILSSVFINLSHDLLIEALEDKARLINKNISIVSKNALKENSFTFLQRLIMEIAEEDRELNALIVANSNGTVMATSDEKRYRLFSKLDDPEITRLLDSRKEGIFYSREERELKSIRFICVDSNVPGIEQSSQAGSEEKRKTSRSTEKKTVISVNKIGEGASSPKKDCEEMIGFIYLSLTTKNLQKSVQQLMVFSIVFTLVLILLGIIVAYRFGSEITSPIMELADNVRQIASGNMDVKIQSQSRNEIGNLITDVEIMRQSIMKADRLKEEFLSNLSHELKTPLTVVYGYAELLKDADEGEFETLKSYSKEIFDNSEILMNYINDLILIADIESQPKLTIGEINLDELVKLSLDKFSSLIGEKRIKIKSYIEKDITISADENYIQQVVDNIIKNAVIFNLENGEISISAIEADDKIRLVIDDTGNGIPEENIHRIWEKFYRVETSLTYEVGGVGVGLFLAKRIVELHGGTIYAESEIGNGSRFTIVFPIQNKGSRGRGN